MATAPSPPTNGLGSVCDLLGQGTITSLASDPFFGPDGSGGLAQSATEVSVDLFDVRGYRKLLAVWEGTFANAVTVTLKICFGTRPAQATSTFGNTNMVSASNGGATVVLAGDTIEETSATSVYGAFPHTYGPFMGPYVRLQGAISGATGTITGGRLSLFGMR